MYTPKVITRRQGPAHRAGKTFRERDIDNGPTAEGNLRNHRYFAWKREVKLKSFVGAKLRMTRFNMTKSRT